MFLYLNTLVEGKRTGSASWREISLKLRRKNGNSELQMLGKHICTMWSWLLQTRVCHFLCWASDDGFQATNWTADLACRQAYVPTSNDPGHCSTVAGWAEKRRHHLTCHGARTAPLCKPLIQHFVVQILAQEPRMQNSNSNGQVFEYSSYSKDIVLC